MHMDEFQKTMKEQAHCQVQRWEDRKAFRELGKFQGMFLRDLYTKPHEMR